MMEVCFRRPSQLLEPRNEKSVILSTMLFDLVGATPKDILLSQD
jgi:hypothetical protein